MDTNQEGGVTWGNKEMLECSHAAEEQLAFEGHENKEFKIGQWNSFADTF